MYKLLWHSKNEKLLWEAKHSTNGKFEVVWDRFFIPTGGVKPAGSGTGLPVRFVRKPVKTGGIRISNQNAQFKWFPLVYRPVQPVPSRLTKKTELVENLTCFQIWIKIEKIKENFFKNIARCIESNGVNTFQILVHLVFFAGY
jgi:hypothetical protein